MRVGFHGQPKNWDDMIRYRRMAHAHEKAVDVPQALDLVEAEGEDNEQQLKFHGENYYGKDLFRLSRAKDPAVMAYMKAVPKLTNEFKLISHCPHFMSFIP